jgi:hypothetical protein
MDNDIKKEPKKNIFGLIAGEERLIAKESKKQFNIPQLIDEFKKEFENGDIKYIEIDPCLPDFKPRLNYINKLKFVKQCLRQERDKKIKEAISSIKFEYEEKLKSIEHAIKKLEAIIFLKDKCKMVILENGIVK